MSELAKHVGHWLQVRSARELRCHPCSQTILLPSTATEPRTPPRADADQCTRHPGEWEGFCRLCPHEDADLRPRPQRARQSASLAVIEQAKADVAAALARRPVPEDSQTCPGAG